MNTNTPQGIPRKAEALMAFIGLLIFMPLLAIIAFVVKTTSPGPILFRQKRIGVGGKSFTLLKFRTMKVRQTGLPITAADDRRITRHGRKLRQMKLDELPELWNVLRGDMSFVGPRPEVPSLVDLENPLWQEILRVRPGITDPVTLRLRNEEALLAKVSDKEAYYRDILQPYKINGYVKFVRKRSWKSDTKIVCQTVKAVILPQTAPPPTKEEMGWSFAE